MCEKQGDEGNIYSLWLVYYGLVMAWDKGYCSVSRRFCTKLCSEGNAANLFLDKVKMNLGCLFVLHL